MKMLMKMLMKMKKGEAFLVLFAGLIMGTVFIFGKQYWNMPITQDEAQQVSAVFSSYEVVKRHGHLQEVILLFDGFMYLGIFCYILAAAGLCYFILLKKKS